MTETGTILVRTLILSGRLGRQTYDEAGGQVAAGDDAVEGDGFSRMFSELGGDADAADFWSQPPAPASSDGDSALSAFLSGKCSLALVAGEFLQHQDSAEGLDALPVPDDAGGLPMQPLADMQPEGVLHGPTEMGPCVGVVKNPASWCGEPVATDRTRSDANRAEPQEYEAEAKRVSRDVTSDAVATDRTRSDANRAKAPEYEAEAKRVSRDVSSDAAATDRTRGDANRAKAPEYEAGVKRVSRDVSSDAAATDCTRSDANRAKAPEYETEADFAPWGTSEEISAAAQATIASLAQFWFPGAKSAPEQLTATSDAPGGASVERRELSASGLPTIITPPELTTGSGGHAGLPGVSVQTGAWSADSINNRPAQTEANIAPATDTPASDAPAEIGEVEDAYSYGMPVLPGEFKPVWRTPARAETPRAAAASVSATAPHNTAQGGAVADASTQPRPGLVDTSAVTGADAPTDADASARPALAIYDAPPSPPRDAALASEMKLTMLRQETHFAHVMPLSPAEQIAGRITGEVVGIIASDAPESASSAAKSTDAPPEPTGSTVKVLHIQLDPPELGPLTVRMSMKDGTLDLRIEAKKPETAALIERDREAIYGLLRAAGYSVDGLSVQVAAAPSAATNNGAQQQLSGQLPQGWQQPGGQMAGHQGQHGQGHGDGRGAATRGNSNENAEAAANRSAGGAVYL